MGNQHVMRLAFLGALLLPWAADGQPRDDQPADAVIASIRGTNAWVMRRGSGVWDPAYVNQKLRVGDRLTTRPSTTLKLRLPGRGIVSILENTDISIPPAPNTNRSKISIILEGIGHFFHFGEPDDVEINSRTASALIRGTEFVVQADPAGTMVVTLLRGAVELSNEQGSVLLQPGEQGRAPPLGPPTKTPAIDIPGIIQWFLYYPAVLHEGDLRLEVAQREALQASLEHYRRGNLIRARLAYPERRNPTSQDETLYLAALELAMGQVDAATDLLSSLSSGRDRAPSDDRMQRLALALQSMIAMVKGMHDVRDLSSPRLATEWLVQSYLTQARAKGSGTLAQALEEARKAADTAPAFAYAWARVAELEFSFGNTSQATKALDTALNLAPDHAQALALRGFLLSARNQTRVALDWFDKAIAADPGLGNGWLGRGLARYRLGRIEEAIEDLRMAAASEPNRSFLRSYLGKGLGDSFEEEKAMEQLEMAQQLDPADPTPWLYSALLKNQQNRINAAIEDLEHSKELNDNRRVYRSDFLLDQDQAVRGASLATLYRRAGMDEVSVREAASAVGFDYANYSAHLFLAESYDALRDPTRFNLRHETVWFNEYLLANILAPVGATPLSQNITQQEYSGLFERHRPGLTSDTEYRGDGQIRERASQFATIANTAYAIDLDYQHNDGIRKNNDLERLELYGTLKQQLSPRDSVLLRAKYQDYESGDNFQHYDPDASQRPNFRFEENQEPILIGAYHHEWSPGIHTLAMGGRLENDQHLSDLGAPQTFVVENGAGTPVSVLGLPLDVDYRSEFETYTAELNQVVQGEQATVIAGARHQWGEFDTRALFDPNAGQAGLFGSDPVPTRAREDFGRWSSYLYLHWKPIESLVLMPGISYDVITYPRNFRNPPLTAGEDTRERINPKAGLVWSPLKELTFRGAYARSLGGVSFDESFRLEPTQIAGFAQSYRTLISETVAGSVSAPEQEIAGLALDLSFPTSTYVSLQGDLLQSELSRETGAFVLNDGTTPADVQGYKQALDYDEWAFTATINQLLSEEWSLGSQYRYVQSELDDTIGALASASVAADSSKRADLHALRLFAVYNHASGFFALGESAFYQQFNSDVSNEDFEQFNLFFGYRFPRRFGEASVGVVNLTDQDYRLNPLNVTRELPRERAFVARLKIAL